jgi:hypothetical protein
VPDFYSEGAQFESAGILVILTELRIVFLRYSKHIFTMSLTAPIPILSTAAFTAYYLPSYSILINFCI